MLNSSGKRIWSMTALLGAVILQTACGSTTSAPTVQPPVASQSISSPVATTAPAQPTVAPTIVASPTAAATAAPTQASSATLMPASATPAATVMPAATVLPQPTALPVLPTAAPTLAPTATPAAPAPAQAPANSGNAATEQARLSLTPTFDRAIPARLTIPKIGVDAAVESVGKSPTDAMANPTRWEDVGWYNLGAHPGEVGTVVIAGHLDSTTGPAVFWHLSELKAGDKLTVTDNQGKVYTYQVESTVAYPYDKAPLHDIFDNLFAPRLNLITCRGDFDKTTKNYNQRLVVYTRLVS